MQSIHSLTLDELGALVGAAGEKPFRAKQIFHWVYEKKVADWDRMTDLNKELRTRLQEKFSLSSIRKKSTEESKDGETIKFLWELSDGKLVESVLICSHRPAHRLRLLAGGMSRALRFLRFWKRGAAAQFEHLRDLRTGLPDRPVFA